MKATGPWDYTTDLCGENHSECPQIDQMCEQVYTGNGDWDLEVEVIGCSCPCHELEKNEIISKSK